MKSIAEILHSHKNWLDGNNGTKLVWHELHEDEKVNFVAADLENADLKCADLENADLRFVYLENADLRGCSLMSADLRDSNLRFVDLETADLRLANLGGSNLKGANLIGANLEGVHVKGTSYYHLQCPEEGSFIAYKKLRDNKIAKLEIPTYVRRSSATTRKCRASVAEVLEIFSVDNHDKKSESFEVGYSIYDESFEYEVGEFVFPNVFNEDRWVECASGIHFFVTLQEAIDY